MRGNHASCYIFTHGIRAEGLGLAGSGPSRLQIVLRLALLRLRGLRNLSKNFFDRRGEIVFLTARQPMTTVFTAKQDLRAGQSPTMGLWHRCIRASGIVGGIF